MSASFVRLQERVEFAPELTDDGLKLAVHVGAEATATFAVQVLEVPAEFTTVTVHVWLAVGLKDFVPVAPDRVPDPRLPVQA